MAAETAFDLQAGECVLRFTPNDGDWTSVTLRREGVESVLGAGMFEYLVEHLRCFLERPAAQLKWVLTLSETHVTAYESEHGEGLILRMQDAKARFFADILISEEGRGRWLETLRGLLSAH